MITWDLHSHTRYSHGKNSPAEMYAAAVAKGMTLFGFSEHSPRPVGYDYPVEYREQLSRHFDDYINEVQALKSGIQAGANGPCRVLLGMEMDWLDGQEDFARTACAAHDFDYLLGSVHFLGTWGFDGGSERWDAASQEECDTLYTAYFTAWEQMLASRMFNIAAHPDIIKIFSVERFHIWLAKPESQAQVRRCLTVLRDAGMGMEISSAGLRKPCREIYPCPTIMRMARELDVPVSFASDAHNCADVGHAFAQLANYARAFGFERHVCFERGQMQSRAF